MLENIEFLNLDYHIDFDMDTCGKQVQCSRCNMIIPMGMAHLRNIGRDYKGTIRLCFKCGGEYLRKEKPKIKDLLKNITNKIPKVELEGWELKRKINETCKICKFRFKKLTDECMPYKIGCPLRDKYYKKE